MSGEQVEQMKKTDRGSKDGKTKREQKNAYREKYCGSGCCSGGSLRGAAEHLGERGVCHGESTGGRKLVEAVTFRDYQYDNGGHAADIKTPELTVKESDTEQMTDTEVQVQENLKKTMAEINAEIEKITDQIVSEFEESRKEEEGLSGGRGQARSYQHDRRLLYVKADVLSGGRQRRGVGLLLYD